MNSIEDMPAWLIEFYGGMSNFEIAQLQAIQIDNLNSIVTIFMSALFAFFMLSQFFAKKIINSQIVVITIVYSFFMLYEIYLMGSHLVNTYNIQLFMSSVSGGVLEETNLLAFMLLPLISFIAWLISVVYMWTSSRQK